MSDARLTVDVHVAPMRPFVGPAGEGPGDTPTWSPMASTLIAGEFDAVLVDTLITLDQVDELAAWVRRSCRNLTAVYITHGHADHWIGLARLLEHFPSARAFALPDVVERARFEATDAATSAYWRAIFPGELPDTWVLPEPLPGGALDLEGHELRALELGWGDTEHSTVLHVPSERAVIAGDVVYQGVHLMTAETDAASRDAWIANLDAVAALDPIVVVAGHMRPGSHPTPDAIAATQRYLRDFSRIVEHEDAAADIVAAMLAIHGHRENPRVLWHSARAAVARRS